MIEIPGFKPLGIRSRIGVPGQWPQVNLFLLSKDMRILGKFSIKIKSCS